MKGQVLHLRRSTWRRAAQLAATASAIVVTGSLGGCLNRPLEPNDPRTTSTVVERLTESAVD